MMILGIEQWRAVAVNNRYEVSNCGAVRTASTGQRLKPWVHRSGHEYVKLSFGRKASKRSFQVHKLVLQAFGPDQPSGTECRHLDGNSRNNRLSNLAWGTRAENIADLKRTSGRYARATLSDNQAATIRAELNGKHGQQSAIARRFGVSLCVVNDISRGRTYACVGS